MRGKRREDLSWRELANAFEKHAAEVLDHAADWLDEGEAQEALIAPRMAHCAARLRTIRLAIIGRVVARGQMDPVETSFKPNPTPDEAAAENMRCGRVWLRILTDPMAVLTETERAEVRAVFEEIERMLRPAEAAMRDPSDPSLRRTT